MLSQLNQFFFFFFGFRTDTAYSLISKMNSLILVNNLRNISDDFEPIRKVYPPDFTYVHFLLKSMM